MKIQQINNSIASIKKALHLRNQANTQETRDKLTTLIGLELERIEPCLMGRVEIDFSRADVKHDTD